MSWAVAPGCISVMPSSLSSRSRSAREAAVIAARSAADGGAGGGWVCAASPAVNAMEAMDASSTLADLDSIQDVILPQRSIVLHKTLLFSQDDRRIQIHSSLQWLPRRSDHGTSHYGQCHADARGIESADAIKERGDHEI